MLLAMVLTARRAWSGDTTSLVVVACLVAVWSRIDAEFEGPRIFRMVDGHSLVLADLFGIVIGLVAAGGWLRSRLIVARRSSNSGGDE